MNGDSCCRSEPASQLARERDSPREVRASGKAHLLSEILRFGGEDRAKGAEGALVAFQSALANLVRENPKAYGADEDPTSQCRVVAQLFEPVRDSFLVRTAETVRHNAGYVKVFGHWVHRAIFTFVSFGFLLAVVLPFCIVSLMSDSGWGWLPGVCVIVVALLAGVWILTRVRNR